MNALHNILIVDDHQIVGEGTKELLEKEAGFAVQYTSSSKAVLEMGTVFDIYLIDIHMPELSGIELSQRLLKQNKELKIILYTGLSDQKNLELFTQLGISGVISKTATRSELITLIKTVLLGYTIVPLSIFKEAQTAVSKKYNLAEVDISILQYISKGLSNKEIGEKVFLSDRAVEYRLTKMYKLLSVKTRGEAVLEAVRLGLIHND